MKNKTMKNIISFILCTLGIVGLSGSLIPAFITKDYGIRILISIVVFILSTVILAGGAIIGIKNEDE